MKFGSAIQLITKAGDDPIQFLSANEAVTWLETQAAQWSEQAAAISDAASQFPNSLTWANQHVGLWQGYSTTAKNQLSQLPDSESENAFRAHFNQIRTKMSQGGLLWVGDDIGQRALSLAEVDPEASLWALMIGLGHARWFLIDNNNPAFWAQFGRTLTHLSEPKVAAAFHRKQRAAITNIENLTAVEKEKVDLLEASFHGFQKEHADFLEGSSKQVALSLEETKQSAADQRDEVSREWLKMRTAYDAELKLRAPREYWNVKFSDHGAASQNWRRAFFVTAFCSAVIIALSMTSLARSWISIPASLSSYGWIIPAGVVGFPAFLSLWLLRLCGRQWSDHLMRREDSRERVVMIETFLAISRDSDSPGAITEPGQLGLVLSSIFRPGPGMSTDDSPPVGFIEAALTRIGSQRPH
jgi:hypothetical protein